MKTKTIILTKYFIIGLLTLSPLITQAQIQDFENLEEVSDTGFFKKYITNKAKAFWDGYFGGEPVGMDGGIGINTRMYAANGIENRQSPFFWTVNANVNFNIYKFNVPFSALVSVNQFEITAPNPDPQLPPLRQNLTNRFNRIGASPYYKWIKLHGGHRSMNFSEYTLSNLVYLGGGVDLTPNNWRISALYGRLAKAEPLDLSLITPNVPIYQRFGWGTKVGYGSNDNFIDVMLFKAWDDPNSIAAIDPPKVFPNENMVIGIKGQKSLFEKFRLGGEFARSALTPNVGDAMTGNAEFPFVFIDERENTTYKNAYNANFDYQGNGFVLGAKYRRIDPDYKSLGAYFFNNDIEDYTINTSFALLQQKLQFAGSIGVQRDNLAQTKPSTLTRVIGSTNINYTQNALNLGLTYSNYSSDVTYVLDQDLDSLNVVIVTQDLGGTISYSISDSSQNQHSFALAMNLQDVTDDIQDATASAASQMFNTNFVYTLTLASGWGINANVNYNQNALSNIQTERWGGGGGVSKNFLEGKINTNLSVNYFKTNITTNNLSNSTLNTRLGFNFKINKAHSLNASAVLMARNRTNATGGNDQFTETIGNIGYRFNFGWHPFKEKEEAEKGKKADK
jgi:hypothetical protein